MSKGRCLFMKKFLSLFAYAVIALFAFQSSYADTSIKVLQFNVWKSGSAVSDGTDAIVKAIIQSNADIVSLNEINELSPKIVEALKKKGHDYYMSKSDISSILSKYPITDTAVIFPPKKISKAVIKTPDGSIAVYSTHLDHTHYSCYYPRGYDGNSWKKMDKPILDVDLILKDTLASNRPKAIALVVEDAKKEIEQGNSIIVAGDFNEPSHRDWDDSTKHLFGHNGVTVPWPTTTTLENNGFIDAYRKQFPNPATHPGFTFPANNPAAKIEELTWAPDADERDRIDFIFYYPQANLSLNDAALFGPKGSIIKGKREKQDFKDPVIEPKQTWPSDHNAVIATFLLKGEQSPK